MIIYYKCTTSGVEGVAQSIIKEETEEKINKSFKVNDVDARTRERGRWWYEITSVLRLFSSGAIISAFEYLSIWEKESINRRLKYRVLSQYQDIFFLLVLCGHHHKKKLFC